MRKPTQLDRIDKVFLELWVQKFRMSMGLDVFLTVHHELTVY